MIKYQFLVVAALIGGVLTGKALAQEIQALVVHETMTDTLSQGGMQAYAINVMAGQFVYGEVEQQTVDVIITIYKPDGSETGTFDHSARGPEPFQFTSSEAGSYRLEIKPYEEERGLYSLEVQRMEPVAVSPGGKVDQLMAAYEGSRGPGAVIAVMQGGAVVFEKAYGQAELAHGIPLTGASVLDIGSLSKQFTGFAIAMLEQQGVLSLDTDVRTYLPELPEFEQVVTLRNLLHHTSGYREVYNTLILMGWQNGDPVLQEDALAVVQRQTALQAAPGATYNYNNSGYMLLADVIERVTGLAFHKWMASHIFEPLGMANTAIMHEPGQVIAGAAESYVLADEGGYLRIFDNSSVQGAGGIYSTVQDLAQWMRNFKSGAVGGIETIRQLTERGVLTNGDTLSYGLGIHLGIHRGRTRWEHSGASAAYRSFLAYYPEIDAGVIVLSNLGSFDAGTKADEVATLFFSEHMNSVQVAEELGEGNEGADTVMVSAEVLKAYAGDYLIEGPNVAATFRAEGGRLTISINDEVAQPLLALNDSTFMLPVWNATLTFHRDTDGFYSRASLDRGEVFALQRIDPWTPTPKDLALYAGRYFSEEIETVYMLAVEDETLVLKHRSVGSVVLRSQKRDTFESASPLLQVRFVRDDNSSIASFSISNGRTQGVRFEKLN